MKQQKEQNQITVENFEHGDTFRQFSQDVINLYHKLDQDSKYIFTKDLMRTLNKIDAEDWRGGEGKQRERNRILKDKVLPDLKGLIAQQEDSEFWRRRLFEGKSPKEARLQK